MVIDTSNAILTNFNKKKKNTFVFIKTEIGSFDIDLSDSMNVKIKQISLLVFTEYTGAF